MKAKVGDYFIYRISGHYFVLEAVKLNERYRGPLKVSIGQKA
jgi:hypothetical protein